MYQIISKIFNVTLLCAILIPHQIYFGTFANMIHLHFYNKKKEKNIELKKSSIFLSLFVFISLSLRGLNPSHSFATPVSQVYWLYT